MVTHFFLYLAVVDITSIWSRIDWAYMWFIITWDLSSGRSTGSRCSGGSWLSTKFVNCGGTMGGPAAEDKLVLSSLGLCWPHSLSLYLDSNDLKLESLTRWHHWTRWQFMYYLVAKLSHARASKTLTSSALTVTTLAWTSRLPRPVLVFLKCPDIGRLSSIHHSLLA